MEILQSLIVFPDELTSIQISSLVLVSFLTCFFSGIIGIGGGLILLAFYATVLPITAVIPSVLKPKRTLLFIDNESSTESIQIRKS